MEDLVGPEWAMSEWAMSEWAMTALEFAELARRLVTVLRSLGHDAPAFRSPPRSPGLGRSLSRLADGTVQVSVQLRDRAPVAVAADMIEGAVAANRLTGTSASEVRDALWSAAQAVLLAERYEPRAAARLAA